MATTDTNVPQVIVNKLTQAQYNAAVKDPTEFYAVTDGQIETADIANNAVTANKASFTTYSTTEQVIGTWIDGKPLYRKTVNCGAGPNNGIVYTPLNVTGARVHNLYGTGINSAGGALPVNSVRPVDGINSSIGAYYNGAQIAIESGTDRSAHTFYITVEYTKASD